MTELTHGAQSAAEISFLGTGDCGPVHGPQDGFPIERYTELVTASASIPRAARPVKPRRTDASRLKWQEYSPTAGSMR
jgi:hypothetical protein